MRKYLFFIYASFLALAFTACTNEDYKVYDTSQKDAVFFNYLNASNVNDSIIEYAFNYDIATEHVISLPLSLMGMPSQTARTVDLEPVADSTTMVEGTHYTIDPVVLQPDSISTTANIHLLRDKDPQIQQKTFRLRLRITENGDLRPEGQRDFTIVYSDIRPASRPDWWNTWDPLPEYSFENAQLFFKYFYELAPKANKSVYDEMIQAYGDYFVNAKANRGPTSMYDNFLIQYVLIPMYNDTKDQIKWQTVPQIH